MKVIVLNRRRSRRLLAKSVKKQHGGKSKIAQIAVDCLLSAIEDALQKHDKVSITSGGRTIIAEYVRVI